MTFLEDVRTEVRRASIDKAVGRRDTPAIFDWLLTAFSYQGVSDQVARTYMQQNGRATWSILSAAFEAAPACPLLRSYWHYAGCRYDKGSFSCANPEHIADCLVPRRRQRPDVSRSERVGRGSPGARGGDCTADRDVHRPQPQGRRGDPRCSLSRPRRAARRGGGVEARKENKTVK